MSPIIVRVSLPPVITQVLEDHPDLTIIDLGINPDMTVDVTFWCDNECRLTDLSDYIGDEAANSVMIEFKHETT